MASSGTSSSSTARRAETRQPPSEPRPTATAAARPTPPWEWPSLASSSAPGSTSAGKAPEEGANRAQQQHVEREHNQCHVEEDEEEEEGRSLKACTVASFYILSWNNVALSAHNLCQFYPS